MKLRKIMFSVLGALAVTASFTACSDDDEWNPLDEGSKVYVAQTRAFVLNEGAYQKNNAGITYFDWVADTTFNYDLFMAQNGKQLGDTGQDIIEEDGYIYVAVYGSNYITKLNGFGVELATVKLPEELGEVRYMVEEDGYLYVTCYGGYVAKVQTSDLKYVASVKVGDNPEYIIEEDGVIYCTNSGWGKDNRVAAISTSSFSAPTFYNVMGNPDHIIEVNDRIFVQGYGDAYDYPWGELDVKTGKFTQIGNASTWAAYDDVLYLVNSVTDWSTYTTTNYFSTYNTKTNQLTEGNFLKNMPSELATTSIFSMSVNPYNGHLYLMTSDFVNNGKIYHFDEKGNFVKQLESTGVGPRKIVFFK